MNQYRCETCNKDDCDHHPNNVEYLRAVENHSLADVITSDWVAFRQFGCASHSSFNPQAERDSWTTDELIEHEKLAADTERERVLSKFADLIHNESVKLSPAMVDMVYSYRVAQIIVELREGKDGE